MLSGRVPPQLKRRVDTDPRANQDVIQAALRRYLGTDEASVLEMRLDHRRTEREMLERERRDLEERINRLDEEIEAMETQVEDVLEAEQEYADGLDEILDGMIETGMHVDPGHGSVDTLAETHNVPAVQVIDDLQERADERGLDLPTEQFEAKGGGRR